MTPDKQVIVGIDNGVTGTIGIVSDLTGSVFCKTPVRKTLDFQVSKPHWLNRLDGHALKEILYNYKEHAQVEFEGFYVYLENPSVNPKRWTASMSAIRCWEATLIILEDLRIKHEFLTSKPWQAGMLPAGIKGAPQLKEASKQIGIRLFPEHEQLINSHSDADGILIAEYYRRLNKS